MAGKGTLGKFQPQSIRDFMLLTASFLKSRVYRDLGDKEKGNRG